MKHRYHLWLAGALVVSSASIAEARKWKGAMDGNTYPTLLACFAHNPTCTPQARVISVADVGAIPKKSVETARMARGVAPPPQPIYVIRLSEGRRVPKPRSGGVPFDEVRACWTIGTNNFSQPGSNGQCGPTQVLVNVIEH